ncbi:MAG TPA: cytochrome c [Phycisphaerae bacterium]|nr:cytochrome c [Phycisphaerae bacterium]
MPRWIRYAIIILAALALIPPVLIARARAVKSDRPRLHLVPDMDNQPRYKAQQSSPLFADGREMRRPVSGTVARGDLREDDRLYRGMVGEDWATTFPMPVTRPILRHGQERFGVFCAPCHGLDGAGRGIVAVIAEEKEEPTWVPPLSVHSEEVRKRAVGHLFNTITNGVRTMPGHASQIPVEDRWAIVAYLRALQKSRDARIGDVPPEVVDSLR